MTRVFHGDCLELLGQIGSGRVDSVVTDPPYEIGLSHLEWDKKGVAFSSALWSELFRVCKPGAHVIAFAAPRTYHFLARAAEEAGFELRDQLVWYHNGFMARGINLPKSIEATVLYGAANSKALKRVEQELGGESYTLRGTNNGMRGGKVEYQRKVYAPSLPEALPWIGWSSTLRPRQEPMILARKPMEVSSLAKNVLDHGVGALRSQREDGPFIANVFEHPKPDKAERADNPHPTIKPIALMRDLVRLVTPDGGIVLDPFAGSGTTLVAALREGVRAIGMELDKDYYEYASLRVENEKKEVESV